MIDSFKGITSDLLISTIFSSFLQCVLNLLIRVFLSTCYCNGMVIFYPFKRLNLSKGKEMKNVPDKALEPSLGHHISSLACTRYNGLF